MKRNKVLEVGITGGIGSGKSIICKIFKILGIPIYNSDDRAKYLMNYKFELKEKIIQKFGKGSYDQEEKLNRSHLAKQVFNDSNKVQILNSLVHPEVAKDYLAWVENQKNIPYLLNEAALMFESGRYKTLDKVITVFAHKNIRIKRVLARDIQRNQTQVEAIIQKQMPEEEKLSKADFIIYNDDSKLVIPQVLDLHQKFLSI